MKNTKLFLALVFVFILSISISAQVNTYQGKVIEIVDGKTIIVEPQRGVKITLELQHIETPEPEQQLHQVVKNHLKKLLLNQVVEFKLKGFSETKSTGQVVLNGVDISQQMIRDGAAWYAVASMKGQDDSEIKTYQSIESQAKSEKRGVWSITNLKPAWVFRAEKEEEEERQRQEERKKQEAEQAKRKAQKNKEIRNVSKRNNQPITSGRLAIEEWSVEIPYRQSKKNGITPVKRENGLWYFQDYIDGESWVGTSLRTMNMFHGNQSMEIIMGAGYDYKGTDLIRGGNIYSIGVGSLDKSTSFLKKGFRIEVDNKKINLTKALFTSNDSNGKHSEFIAYKISRDELLRIGKSQNAVLIIGNYKEKINKRIKDSFMALAFATK